MAKILIAEDDALTSQLVSFKLKQHGFIVLSAPDGETALALAQSDKPAVILLDFMMPVMDGFAVLRRNQDSPEFKTISVNLATFRYTATPPL